MPGHHDPSFDILQYLEGDNTSRSSLSNLHDPAEILPGDSTTRLPHWSPRYLTIWHDYGPVLYQRVDAMALQPQFSGSQNRGLSSIARGPAPFLFPIAMSLAQEG